MYNLRLLYREALNLSDSPPIHRVAIKREHDRDHHNGPDYERERDLPYPPEKKRVPSTPVRHQPHNLSQLDSSTEERSTPPAVHENGSDYTKPPKNNNKSNNNGGGGAGSGDQNVAPMLNGMQFKIISRGKKKLIKPIFELRD